VATAKTAETEGQKTLVQTLSISIPQYLAGTIEIIDLAKLSPTDIVAFLRYVCRGISPGVSNLGAVRLDEQTLLNIRDDQRSMVHLDDGLTWQDEVIIIIDWIDPSKGRWHDPLPDSHVFCRSILLDKCGSIVSFENIQKIGWRGSPETPSPKMRSIRIRKLSEEDILHIIVERNLVEDFLHSLLFVISQQLSRVRNQERDILEAQFFLRSACRRVDVRLVR
jgi:hypothetical protein